MEINNFKKLEEIQLKEFTKEKNEKIKNNIHSNLGMFKFATNILELYFPYVYNLFLHMLGGKSEDE